MTLSEKRRPLALGNVTRASLSAALFFILCWMLLASCLSPGQTNLGSLSGVFHGGGVFIEDVTQSSHMLGKGSTTDLHPSLSKFVFSENCLFVQAGLALTIPLSQPLK